MLILEIAAGILLAVVILRVLSERGRWERSSRLAE